MLSRIPSVLAGFFILRGLSCLLFSLALPACDRHSISVCLTDEEEVQVAPSKRAVALVNPSAYSSIVHATGNTRADFNCAVDDYLARFQTKPEAIIFVLDFEDRFVTHARLMYERGFHYFGDLSRDMTEDEASRYIQALQEVSNTVKGMPSEPASAFNARYRDLEVGTGTGSFAVCSSFCPDFLRGYVFLPTKEQLVAGRFLHEFAHFWAAHLTGPPELLTQIHDHNSHWGFTSVGGQLGGWDTGTFQDHGNGSYSARSAPAGRAINQSPYAPLELYLMGLTPSDAVDPIQVAVEVSDVIDEDEGIFRFNAKQIATIPIQDIIRANGMRDPSFDDSPKQFNLALVIVTDHALTEGDWKFYERSMDFLEAKASTDLLALFPEEEYPGHNDTWRFFSDNSREPYLNFFMSTSGQGSLHFVPVE